MSKVEQLDMVFERPKPKVNKPSSPINPLIPPTQRATQSQSKKVITTGGGSGGKGRSGSGGGGSHGGGSNSSEPSPWLDHPQHSIASPNSSASFVEYLRWMRSPDSNYKDPTKVQILQLAEEGANYTARLTQLTNRTKLIAGEGNYFQVKCPWRIRVGGHRGPESILLPAFDALGMPFIPSSTLRGVARAEALRQLDNEKEVEKYFGALEAKEGDRMGKVIFLDAYPLPSKTDRSGGLMVDMANNIWSWKDEKLEYAPNPNPFLSLREPIFLIGIRHINGFNRQKLSERDLEIFAQIQQWLIAGLQSGVGSQINTGYGGLIRAGQTRSSQEFFRVEFSLEGQLIHGRQKFTRWEWNDRRQDWQMRGQAEPEVRPVAFKSMLRYWFRAFALGIMSTEQVKEWESKLFGSLLIDDSGWVKFAIEEGKVLQIEPRPNFGGQNDKCGEQAGILTLSHSSEPNTGQQKTVEKLLKNLTWLMFHLGGIGQGARRPCYSRKTRDRAPWYRGSTLIVEDDDQFWELPETAKEFQKLFQTRFMDFSNAIKLLQPNVIPPKNLGAISSDRWREAVDANCKILVCGGDEDYGKPYALAVLHSKNFKVQVRGQVTYDGNLCGIVGREVKPSPVWVADLGDYQIVTVFGATQDPRKAFVEELTKQGAIQIFLIT
jgi:CRISPR-associated protein Cmr6